MSKDGKHHQISGPPTGSWSTGCSGCAVGVAGCASVRGSGEPRKRNRNEWIESMNEWMNESINQSINKSINQSINQWVDQSNNPSSTIPSQFDSTKRSLHHLDGISVQVGARGAVGHLKSSKIHQFLLKTGDCRHTFRLCLGYLRKSEQLAVIAGDPLVSPICAKTRRRCNENTWDKMKQPQIHKLFLVCQDLSQCKSRWTDLRLI